MLASARFPTRCGARVPVSLVSLAVVYVVLTRLMFRLGTADVPGMAGMHDVDDYPDAEQVPGLVVYRYDAPLFFANSNDFYSQVLEAADTPGCRWLVLNVEANVEVDSTGLDALVQLHGDLHARGIRLALARVKNDLMIPMARYGVADVIGVDSMFPTLPTAVEAYREWSAVHPQPQPPMPAAEPAGPGSGGLSLRRFARSLNPRRAPRSMQGTVR